MWHIWKQAGHYLGHFMAFQYRHTKRNVLFCPQIHLHEVIFSNEKTGLRMKATEPKG